MLQIDDHGETYPRSVLENMDKQSATGQLSYKRSETIFGGTLVNVRQEYDQCSELGEVHMGNSRKSHLRSISAGLETHDHAPRYAENIQLDTPKHSAMCCASRDTKSDNIIIGNSVAATESGINLCTGCLQMLRTIDLAKMEGLFHTGETYELHQTPDSLKLSALAKYRLCTMIQQQVDINTH